MLWRTGLVALRHVGSSRTRARTRVPCVGRQILNHCTTREVQNAVLLTLKAVLFLIHCAPAMRCTYHVPGTGNETVCVPFYCSPSVYREMCLDIHCTKFVDLYKYSEISKKENKGGPLFFSSRFTQGNVLPVYIQWNPLLLNAFTIYTCSHFMSILSRCHWYNVQMVLSKLCLDHLWNIVC